MTPERLKRLKQVLALRQPDLTMIADQVNKPRNLSALIRNCDAFGIPEVHAVVPREGYRTYRGTAKGSDFYVKTHSHENIESAIGQVRAQGKKVIAAHFSEQAIDYREFDYTQPCAILMGAEKLGVSEQAAGLADQHIIIPMVGMAGSLNVSTAAGIILAEAQLQRQRAGLFDQCHLTADEISRSLFEWGNRKLAEYCRDNNLAYPPLDEDGEVIDAPGWYQKVRAGEISQQLWDGE